MKKEICIIGLGKMGLGLAQQLLEQDWKVYGIDPSENEEQLAVEALGLERMERYADIVETMQAPRLVWVMVPSGEIVQQVLVGEEHSLLNTLQEGDTVIDGGNSRYTETQKRGKQFAEKRIHFVDAGVSGGPEGARNGACIMVGGPKKLFTEMEQLYADLSIDGGYAHFEGVGAGHYVKMVHNGIEYGMMQAIAEGFNLMKESEYGVDLKEAARVYSHGSVIESALVNWLYDAFQDWGVDLKSISGEVSASGEGEWTIDTAKKEGQPIGVIEEAFEFRKRSQGNPSYTGKLVSAQRGQFGGHPVFITSDEE